MSENDTHNYVETIVEEILDGEREWYLIPIGENFKLIAASVKPAGNQVLKIPPMEVTTYMDMKGCLNWKHVFQVTNLYHMLLRQLN